MPTDKPFHLFESNDELINYLHKWNLLAPTKRAIPNFYYRSNNLVKKCKVIGEEHSFESWSTVVIDFGEGPHFIHTDLFRDMQSAPERHKGNRLEQLPLSYVLFDLETTDRNIHVAEIIQISAIKVQNNTIIAEFDSYVKPNNPIPKMITRITGISDLTVCMSPALDTVLPNFLDFIGNSYLAGYNIHSFDTNILYDTAKSLLNIEFNNDYFDFYYFFKDNIDKSLVTDHKLVTLCEYYGIDTTAAHNALSDCHMCLECYNAFLSSKHTGDSISTTQTEDSYADSSCVNILNTDFKKKLHQKLQEVITLRSLPCINSLFIYTNYSSKTPSEETSTSVYVFDPGYPPEITRISKSSLCFSFTQTTSGRGKNKIAVVDFSIGKDAFEQIPVNFLAEVKPPTDYKMCYTLRVAMSRLDDDALLSYLLKIVEYRIDHYHAMHSFSCCSRYLECSDAMHCVHENLLYATGCGYRKNLENGRIFYGKNRNID